MERLLIVVCNDSSLGASPEASELASELSSALSTILPREQDTLAAVRQQVYRIVTAPYSLPLGISALFVDSCQEVLVDHSACTRMQQLDAGEIDAWMDGPGRREKRRPYQGKNSLAYGFDLSSEYLVVAIVPFSFYQSLRKSPSTPRHSLVELKTWAGTSASRYGEDIEAARLLVSLKREIRGISLPAGSDSQIENAIFRRVEKAFIESVDYLDYPNDLVPERRPAASYEPFEPTVHELEETVKISCELLEKLKAKVKTITE